MLELACSSDGAPVLMGDIAKRQRLSRKHLHALLTSLRSAGLVESVRGPGGGFVLSRPPGDIRLDEILRALEGPLTLVDCVDDQDMCAESDVCVAREVWVRLAETIETVLGRVTLEDLIKPLARRREGGRGAGGACGRGRAGRSSPA